MSEIKLRKSFLFDPREHISGELSAIGLSGRKKKEKVRERKRVREERRRENERKSWFNFDISLLAVLILRCHFILVGTGFLLFR